MLTIDINFDVFKESDHPRGQPENKGEFAKSSGAKTPQDLAWKKQQLARKRASQASANQGFNNPGLGFGVKHDPEAARAELAANKATWEKEHGGSTIPPRVKTARGDTAHLDPTAMSVAALLDRSVQKHGSATLRGVISNGHFVVSEAYDTEHQELGGILDQYVYPGADPDSGTKTGGDFMLRGPLEHPLTGADKRAYHEEGLEGVRSIPYGDKLYLMGFTNGAPTGEADIPKALKGFQFTKKLAGT